MSLSNAQARQLHDAFVSAFDFQELRMLMAYDLGETLEEVVGEGSLNQVVFDLIKWAERNGRMEDLVRAAVQNRPENPRVKAAADAILPPADPSLTPAAPSKANVATYDAVRRRRLREELVESFSRRSDLTIILADTVGENLEAIVSNGTTLEEAAFELTQWLGVDPQARLEPFLAEAIQRRPNNAELKALYAELFGGS